jgi:DnaJ-class molecular chaperone
MTREEQRIKVRNILQDFYRIGEYELEKAEEDIMYLISTAPSSATAEEPHRCPVCGGNGLVPNGFYDQTSGQWPSCSTLPETCRSCNGTGVIFAALAVAGATKERDELRELYDWLIEETSDGLSTFEMSHDFADILRSKLAAIKNTEG